MSITDNVVGCKTCGEAIVFVRTEDGKVFPVNAEETELVMVEEKDGELIAHGRVPGHLPHPRECAPLKKEDAPQPNPEGSKEQDTCPECDAATNYKEWTPEGETKVLQFWYCSADPSCGKWWNTKGSRYTPKWKPA
jgi:hypothetical protein